jgi:hypothetical protein
MNHGGGKNNGRAGKDRRDCADQTYCKKHDREEPPEQFHIGLVVMLSEAKNI